jgi:NitT/TauT family transport system ATP-binding protein
MSILTLKNIKYSFKGKEGQDIPILENVNLTLNEKEVVVLLGRSGCGKSTLLRIIAGLIKPTAGDITYSAKAASSETEGISMIFQTFALFPWLTVQQNIAIGLKDLPKKEIRERCAKVIEIIGLDGYESAYPRELSGGMRQRVGFARALVVNPQILLMDEPFSALDILTAQALRTDFLDLWLDKKVSLNSVLLVTHNIEEAVLLADRIKIFASNPGRIVAEIPVKLAHPRDRLDPEFRKLVEKIYTLMTSKLADSSSSKKVGSKVEVLPLISFHHIENFLEVLYSPPYNGTAELPQISSKLNIQAKALFSVIEGLQILRFADTTGDDIKITSAGRIFMEGNSKVRKQILGEHLIQYIPLAGHIRRALTGAPNLAIGKTVFLRELEQKFHPDKANEVLNSVISWGRDAGLFYYNDTTKKLYLRKKKKKLC